MFDAQKRPWPLVRLQLMLLLETPHDRITEILESARPVALVSATSRNHANEIAIAGRDAGFGIVILQEHYGRILVMVVADEGRIEELRRFAGRYGSEIATDRQVDVERVYVAASWLTGMAHTRGADIGEHL